MRYPWAVLPTDWIHDGELRHITWLVHRSDATAAIALYVALLIKANRDGLQDEALRASRQVNSISTTASYDVLQDFTLLSRSKLSAGLKVLLARGLLHAEGTNRTRTYRIGGSRNGNRWTKLPQYVWYRRKGGLEPLRAFTYRGKVELNALKLYLLLAAFRSNATGLTSISYVRIGEYAGIDKSDVTRAISLLINHQLVHVLHDQRDHPLALEYNAYRLTGFASGPVRHVSEKDFQPVV